MKISKNTYIQIFGVVTILLALYRCAFPGIAHHEGDIVSDSIISLPKTQYVLDTINTSDIVGLKRNSNGYLLETSNKDDKVKNETKKLEVKQEDGRKYHPIYSVPSFRNCFPDNQDMHVVGVKRWGVDAVADRKEAEARMSDLVYIDANPFYTVDELSRSIPYLVPKAAMLLNDIGRNYFDSLYVKGIPLHKIIVTSAMRTKTDVKKLQKYNVNATENSCHLYGTTFDVCYNRYVTVSNPSEPNRRAVQNDTLKWVLSEVLRDMREAGRCYIKYEVKQGCFHITVK